MTDTEEPAADADPDRRERPGPVSGQERMASVDVLRGVAVMGILFMNVYAFAMPVQATTNPLLMGGTEWYNLGTWHLTHVFFEQKFIAIFSMLYGGGLIIMWQRARARQAAFGSIFFRRQRWLLVIGAAHGYLLWTGDILFVYAVIGCLAYFFRKLSASHLIIIGLLLMVVVPIRSFDAAEYLADIRDTAAEVDRLAESGESLSNSDQADLDRWDLVSGQVGMAPDDLAADLKAYRGSYRESVAFRAPEVLYMQTDGLLYYGWRIAGLMLIGMGLMKLGVLSGGRDESLYVAMLWLGYGLGLPATVFSAWASQANGWDIVFLLGNGMLPNYVGSLLVALGHIAVVMLIVRRGRLLGLTSRFGAAGRMALSNYLMHSAAMTTIFYGYGLGLYGSVPRASQLLMVLAMVALQLWLSPLWLEHFRFGPAEWLWRSLTYRQLQPMRRTVP